MDEDLTTEAKARQWLAFKAELATYDEWLEIFSKPAFETALQRVGPNPQAYDPLRFEQHLSASLELASRVRRLLDEAYEHEINAVRAENRLEVLRSAVRRRIEIARLAAEEHKIGAHGFPEASHRFEKSNQSGHARHMKTLGERAAQSLANAEEIERLITRQYDIEDAYQRYFHARHVVRGNAHNYAERYQHTIQLLTESLEELLERSHAIYAGVTTVLKLDLGKPPFDSASGITPLIVWIRRVQRSVHVYTQREVELTRILPLTQKYSVLERPLVDFASFRSSLESPGLEKSIMFNLTDVFPREANIRLRAVGLALDVDLRKMDLDAVAYLRAEASIRLPEQNLENSSHSVRPIVEFGNVGAFGRTIAVATENHPSIHNVDPRGPWEIRVKKRLVYNGRESHLDIDADGNVQYFVDLKLLLRYSISS